MTWRVIDECRQDLRYAVRMIRRRPGFATAAVLTLTLGIGGTTAVFSLIDALLLRRLPVERPEELVRLVEERAGTATPRETFTIQHYEDLQRSSRALSAVIASSVGGPGRPWEIEERGERRLAYLQTVSDNYFDVLGVSAFRGRLISRPQQGNSIEAIAVISHDYWQRHFGADLAALGSRFRMRTGRRVEFTIAGITPPGFRGAAIDVPTDIWVPFDQVVPPDDPDRGRDRWIQVMGRLRSGVSLEQAETEASTIVGGSVRVLRGDVGYSQLRRRLTRPLLLVGVVVGLVLLIACANLANLMLATTASRTRELAIRSAAGASRARVMRQLVTESLVLSALGGMFAIAAAHWISSALLGFLPPDQAIAAPNLQFGLDERVLAFATAVTCMTCLLFGLAPAIRATSRAGTADFRVGAGTGERTRSWLSRGLLMTQIVMCTALLVVSGVFLRSLQNLRGQEAGYREDHLLVADVQPPRDVSEASRDQLIEELRGRVAALPGVEVAAFSHVGQLSGSALEFRISFPGQPVPGKESVLMIEQRISPGFLHAMGTRLVAGRDFTPSDDERGQLVAIVNESFARRFLSRRNPIGARFSRDTGSRAGELMEVVGVVEDSKWSNLRDEPSRMYYRPYGQMGGTPVVRFAIRTSGDPQALAAPLLQAAQTIDRRMTVSNVVPFTEIIDRTLVIERLVAQVSAAFGALALLIAAIGLYGVLSYSVVRRRREIGVRIAIGAPPRSVEWMMMRESLLLLVIGAGVGLPVAIVATKLMSSILFGLSPHDPASIIAALSVLTVATVAAAYIPARRAASTDPILALREE
jgi:predicted permease